MGQSLIAIVSFHISLALYAPINTSTRMQNFLIPSPKINLLLKQKKMSSKAFVFLGLLLAFVLLLSSEVAARDLAETSSKKDNGEFDIIRTLNSFKKCKTYTYYSTSFLYIHKTFGVLPSCYRHFHKIKMG